MTLTKEQDNTENPLYSQVGGGMSRLASFEKDKEIFAIGDVRKNAYIIDSGEVHILDKDQNVLCVLKSGEIFGEMALVDVGVRTANAVAAKDTKAYVIPRKVIEQRMHGLDPLISLLIGLLIERYRVTRIHMPESIREEGAEELIEKLNKGENAEGFKTFLNTQAYKETALNELSMEQELRQALMKKEFIPFLQPIVELPSRNIIGFEALIRWNHPERGIVGPFEFVPVAERTGVVKLLDAMMIEKACAVMPDLIKAAGHDVYVGVNLSGINFESMNLVKSIGDILKKYKTDPKYIRLEITESALIDDPAGAEDILKGLKELGLKIALDDFGTGYSSLSYLHKFSIDTIKIDRAFIDKIDQNPKSLDIVRAIIGLAKTFKLETVAEGIERDEEAVSVSSLGCDRGQGYYFSKPVSVDEAIALLKA
ncbi:MAG: EAL domain-containing protein [Pseudomonadota bacterium]